MEKRELNKKSISELIFYNIHNLNTEANDIQTTINNRLLKSYKIDKDSTIKIIKQDKQIITKRGYKISDYAFSSVITYPRLIEIISIYTKIYNSKDLFYITELNNLAFSELLRIQEAVSYLAKILKKGNEEEKRLSVYFNYMKELFMNEIRKRTNIESRISCSKIIKKENSLFIPITKDEQSSDIETYKRILKMK